MRCTVRVIPAHITYTHTHTNLPQSCWWRRWTDPGTWCRWWRGPGSPRPPWGYRGDATAARGHAGTRRDEDAAASGDAAVGRAVHFAPPSGRAVARRRPAFYRHPRYRRCRRGPHCRRHPRLRETTRAGTGAPGSSASEPRDNASDSPAACAPTGFQEFKFKYITL